MLSFGNEEELSSHERLSIALEPSHSNMGLREYLGYGGLEVDDLRGTVLDIGSGPVERFSREASDIGISVIAVNPGLIYQGERNSVQCGRHSQFGWDVSYLPWRHKSVAALGQELPVATSSVDTIVSCAGVPGYLDPRDYALVLDEMYRVLKPRGMAYLFPVVEAPGTRFDLNRFLTALGNSAFKHTTHELGNFNVPEPYLVAHLKKPA